MPPVDPKMNPATTLAALEQRIAVMNDEDKVRNLQNAYGYYMDRKMWDDVTDLFTADGALSIANVGVYDGPKSIRRALERSGPAGLKHGQLNELMQLDMAVAIEPGGMEARARGLEFGMLGEADKGTAFYTLAIFENRYVKQNDIWRIREMRIFPLMKTDYAQGWAKSQVVDPPPAKEHAPDRPVPASDVMTPGAIPVFFAPNPATGKPVSLPSGAKTVGHERLLPAPAARAPAAPSGDLDARITEAERRLAVSKAWDGAENMNLRLRRLPRRSRLRAAREAVRAEWQQGGSVQRRLRGARAHHRARRDVAAARITPPGVAAPPLADPAGDPRRRRWTLRVHPLAPLPAGLEPHPRHRASGAACITIRSSSKTACGSCGASRSTSTTSRRRRTKAAGRRRRIPIRPPRAGRRAPVRTTTRPTSP